MNAIDYALRSINQQIPKEILQLTFLPQINHRTTIPVTTDSRIKDLIIYQQVMQDINIIGGTHITVPLDGLPIETIEGNAFVVRIPKSRTQGRSIVSVLNVAYGGVAFGDQMVANGLASRTPDIMGATQQMLNSIASIPYMSEAQVMLLADNVVMVQGIGLTVGGLYLRCEVENDSNLSNLKRRSYFAFSKLCVLAVKSCIWSSNIIPMDIGYYQGGMNMGKIQDIIDGYQDAQEEYEEFLLTKWAKVSKLNDNENAERLVRLTAGGNY